MLSVSRSVLTVALLAGSWSLPSAAKDIALISGKPPWLTTITLAELVKVARGQISRWPDGKPVTFVIRDPATPEMKIVLERIYELPADGVNGVIVAANHGRTNRPAIVVVASDEALLRKVETTPGALGLVDVYSITGGVAVVKIAGKLPLEPGYLLHGN